MAAVMAPVMIMVMAMGIEITFWSVNQMELQRIADVAAFAAANNYSTSGNSSIAMTIATNTATLNGIDSGSVTVRVVSGVRLASDTAFQVTVNRSIPQTLSAIFPNQSNAGAVTISATAIAEFVSNTNTPQPCLLALGTGGAGISLTGAASVKSSGCSVVSNAAVSVSGSSTINASGTYAATTITASSGTTIIGGTTPNNPVLPDPYANAAALQAALNALTSGGQTVNLSNGGSQTVSAGTFSSISVNGGAKLSMGPGTYYINGNLQLANGGTITGSGITIIASGSFQLQGGGVMNVTPPTTGATSGIAGVIFASRTTSSGQIGNGATPPAGGLIYYPNGAFSLAGSVPGTLGCNEYIVGSAAITGASNFSSACDNYGPLQKFPSVPTSVVLVE